MQKTASATAIVNLSGVVPDNRAHTSAVDPPISTPAHVAHPLTISTDPLMSKPLAVEVNDSTVEDINMEDPEAVAETVSVCVERWKNAGPEARKKMFALFAVSGVFVCLCRHGHVLIMCDMIRSGEL